MAITINTDIASLKGQTDLNVTQKSPEASIQGMSSGYKINGQPNDAKGPAISDETDRPAQRFDQFVKTVSDTIKKNTQAAEKIRLSSFEMAKDTMQTVKSNLLNQPDTAVLAQANKLPQDVLHLLR